MSFTTINYEEPNPETYKSVEVHSFNDAIKIFDSGDFVKDWWDATKFILTELQDDPFHSCSSSLNHFIMDGAQFDSMYLDFEDGNPFLTSEYIDGVEFFVNKSETPTWEELKNQYDN